MINRRFLMAKLGASSLLAMNAMFFSGSAAWAVPSAIVAFDKDYDGTLDLAEVKEAAGKMFDKLDKDGDGTLTKDEYFTIVEKLFNGADVDKDGALSAKELQSKAGRALLRQMQ